MQARRGPSAYSVFSSLRAVASGGLSFGGLGWSFGLWSRLSSGAVRLVWCGVFFFTLGPGLGGGSVPLAFMCLFPDLCLFPWFEV